MCVRAIVHAENFSRLKLIVVAKPRAKMSKERKKKKWKREEKKTDDQSRSAENRFHFTESAY